MKDGKRMRKVFNKVFFEAKEMGEREIKLNGE